MPANSAAQTYSPTAMAGIISGAVLGVIMLIITLSTCAYCMENSIRKSRSPAAAPSKMEIAENPVLNMHPVVHSPLQTVVVEQQQPPPPPPVLWTRVSDGADTWYVSPTGQSEWTLPPGAQLNSV